MASVRGGKFKFYTGIPTEGLCIIRLFPASIIIEIIVSRVTMEQQNQGLMVMAGFGVLALMQGFAMYRMQS